MRNSFFLFFFFKFVVKNQKFKRILIKLHVDYMNEKFNSFTNTKNLNPAYKILFLITLKCFKIKYCSIFY